MAKTSAKKVARAARSGGGRVAKTDRNVLFPIAMAAVVVVGLFLIVLTRSQRDTAASEPPRLTDHWHSAYVVRVCGVEQPPIPTGADDVHGVHTHGAGLVHIHPFDTTVTGSGATLSAWFAEEGLEISDERLTLPGGQEFENGVTACGEEPGVIRVARWRNLPASEPQMITDNFADVRFQNDAELFVIAFGSPDEDLPRPDDSAVRQISGIPDAPVEAPTATTAVGDPAPTTTAAP